MPSPSQTKSSKKATKTGGTGRRFTTLSFEQLDRVGTGIFTENISSSSRISRPTFVVSHDEIVRANMPDTVQLAKHRGKVYVGVQDINSSAGSSQRRMDTRSLNRETTSAATTIGKASIVDWTENTSEVNASSTSLSGELSVVLPPVPGAQSTSSKGYIPALDTTELFRQRLVGDINQMDSARSKKSKDKSPRTSRSRGGSRVVGGFRPPQNTPFLQLSRPDDFSASIRKTVTPPTSNGNLTVLIRGGGIHPTVSTRTRPLPIISRESTLTTTRKTLSRLNSNVGSANIDMPMIDLKCIESPINNLGNLEEKGIRLVRLRKAKKTKRSQSESDKNGYLSDGDPATGKGNNQNEDPARPLLPTTKPFNTAVPPTSRTDLREGQPTGRSEQKIEISPTKVQEKRFSVTSSSRSDDNPLAQDELILTNREPYSTPLLPDTGRASINKNTDAENINQDGSGNGLSIKTSLLASEGPLINTTVKDDKGFSQGPKLSVPTLPITVTVETFDSTPVPPPNDEEDVFSDNDTTVSGQITGKGRRTKRSSSLLSVPTSEIFSELRPSFGNNPDMEDVKEDTIAFTIQAPDVSHADKVDPKTEIKLDLEDDDDDVGRTIATQTTPPQTNRQSDNTPFA